jgi:hypothetical protein
MAAREHRHRAAAARTQRRVELEHFPITLNRLLRSSGVTRGLDPQVHLTTELFAKMDCRSQARQ